MGQKSWTPGDKPVMSVCYVHISTIKRKQSPIQGYETFILKENQMWPGHHCLQTTVIQVKSFIDVQLFNTYSMNLSKESQ